MGYCAFHLEHTIAGMTALPLEEEANMYGQLPLGAVIAGQANVSVRRVNQPKTRWNTH